MDRVAVEQYLAQAAAAASVRELHAISRAVRVAHADDPDADAVEQACWTAALRLVAARPAPLPPELRAGPPPPGRAHAFAARTPAAPHYDWKERAARS